jgi:hypothetical protein
MNPKIKTISVSRSYDRKITTEKQYEMAGIFASYNATLENPTEEEIDETSKWLFEKAQTEVELQVEIRQNPQKVVRGFASINELRTIVNAQDKKIADLELKLVQLDKPF